MPRKLPILLLVGLFTLIIPLGGCGGKKESAPIGMAVEFMDHAASAYVAQDKGWFEEERLNLSAYESYVTGMALASALARGDIEVAYMCLVPAINAYANAGVPIKIVAGTHRAGYGLVVNPDRIGAVEDLEQPDIRIGCVREGGAVDILLQKTIDRYGLDRDEVLGRVQRMNPPKQVLAIQTGQIDAAFLPEQWATMAEDFGFRMLLTSQDVWPEMQGSVLVVKEELLEEHPEIVSKLVGTSQRATDWINQHPDEAADIVARQLSVTEQTVLPAQAAEVAAKFEIMPEVLLRSMGRLEYTTAVDPSMVQEVIDYMAELGYIKSSFEAKDILDLSFVK
ncbi:MAG: ABC transporter substrate-binding protein [Chloroflexota bacterium]|nr:ABC transporter substrate-binding protein [Chloroflexota bacterium]